MRLTRRGRLIVAALSVTVVAALAALLVVRTPLGTVLGIRSGPPCSMRTGDATVAWSAEQAMTATTVAGVGTRIRATLNGVAEAVSRGLAAVEDADPPRSLTAQQARALYRDLPDVATPDDSALALAEALLGHDEGALTCVVPLDRGELAAEAPGPLGLTPRADAVRVLMREVFGKQPLGGFEPHGVEGGHIDGSAHYEGRAIDVFFRPVSEQNQRLGWQQAQWAVAHAQRLRLATVIFDREIWTARRSVQGWRAYVHPSGDTDNPVLMHEDHVHVDVVEGG